MFELFNSGTYFNILLFFTKNLNKKILTVGQIKETIRYQRNKQNLKSGLTLTDITFVSFIAQDFEAFLVIFQST